MNNNKFMKYTALTTASAMTLQLAACGSPLSSSQLEFDAIPEEELYRTENSITEPQYEVPDAQYQVPDDMTTEDYADKLIEDELTNVDQSEYYAACDDWKESDDGSVQCLDEDSEYYAQHFFNGLMYASIGAMAGSAIYKSMNKKNGEKRQQIINNAVVSPTNKAYSTSGKYNSSTNGSTTNGVNNSTTNQNNSIDSNSSNKNSSTNSYSSGKQGFSSGGASRGGSSSS